MAEPTAGEMERLTALGYTYSEVLTWTPELLAGVLLWNVAAVSPASAEELDALRLYADNPWYTVDPASGELTETRASGLLDMLDATMESLKRVGGPSLIAAGLGILGLVIILRK